MSKLHYEFDLFPEDKRMLINTNYSFIVDSFILVKLPKVFNDSQFRLAKIIEFKATKVSDIEVATIIVLDSDYPELSISVCTINELTEFVYVDKSLLDIEIVDLLNTTNTEELELKRLALVDKRKSLLT
jgi:hypothetical protein